MDDRALYLKYIDIAINLIMMGHRTPFMEAHGFNSAAIILAMHRNVLSAPVNMPMEHTSTSIRLIIPDSEADRATLTEALNNMPPGAAVLLPKGMGFRIDIKTEHGDVCLDNLKEEEA